MSRVIAMLGAFVTVSGCATAHRSIDLATQNCLADVVSFSNPQAGAAGDYRPNVEFKSLRYGSKAMGYGAAGGRSDEITLADGKLHFARPNGSGGHSERRSPETGEGAYMLQLVDVAAWGRSQTLPEIANLDMLASYIGEHVRTAGCAGPTKLAFRIEGRVRRAEWSLDTLPVRSDYTAQGGHAVIVGLYANIDQAKHFVPEGRNLHAHVVSDEFGIAGHLKSLDLDAGAKLQIQAR